MARTKGSDDLFRLIHSLTLVEKSYFKKFAGRHSQDSKYLQLFDSINNQKEFEEKTLKREFPAYTSMKVYLMDMILKSLFVYITDFDTQEDLMREMLYGKILLRKGLPGKALQMVEKGINLAREQELFWMEEEFLRLRVNISQFSWKADEMKRKWLEYYTDIDKVHEKRVNRDRFMKERMKIYLLKKSQAYANQSIKLDEEKVDLKFLKNNSSSLTPGNERIRLYALYEYYMVYDDFENAYAIAIKVMDTEKKLLDKIKPGANFKPYMYAVKLRIASCFETDRVKEVGDLLDNEWMIIPEEEREQPEHFNFYFYMRALHYWMSGSHMNGERFIESHIDSIMTKEYQEQYAEHVEVILPIKIMFEFSNGNDRKAALSINEYQQLSSNKSHIKYLKDCELLRILIQVEMENFEVMAALIRNILRKSRKLGITALEMKFLNVLKKMNNINKKEIFGQLYSIFKNADEKVDILWLLPLRDWIQSKYEGSSLAEVRRILTEEKK